MISTILRTAHTETSETASEKIATALAAFRIASSQDAAWNRRAWWHYGLTVLYAVIVFSMLWVMLHGILVTADGKKEANLLDQVFFVAAAGFSSLIVFSTRGKDTRLVLVGFFIYITAYGIITYTALRDMIVAVISGLDEYLNPLVSAVPDMASDAVSIASTAEPSILPWLLSVALAGAFAAALYFGESGLWRQKERGDAAIEKRDHFRKIMAECQPLLEANEKASRAYREYCEAQARVQEKLRPEVKESMIAGRALELVSEKIDETAKVLDARRRFERRQGTDADIRKNDLEIQKLEADIVDLESRKSIIPAAVQALCRGTS